MIIGEQIMRMPRKDCVDPINRGQWYCGVFHALRPLLCSDARVA